jgi:hypothetical protein
MTTLTEGRHAGGFIVSEAENLRSRSVLTLIQGESVKAGQVLGLVAGSAPDEIEVTVTKGAGSTGGGTLTMANPATGAGVTAGTYIAVCTATASNAGTFKVFAPDGSVVGNATVGVAFNDDVKFTIADVGTDFAVGDFFSLAVEITTDALTGDCAAFDQDAVDGTQIAAVVAFDNADATAAPVEIVVMARSCQVAGVDLVWPADLEAGELAAGIQQLATRGVIVR